MRIVFAVCASAVQAPLWLSEPCNASTGKDASSRGRQSR